MYALLFSCYLPMMLVVCLCSLWSEAFYYVCSVLMQLLFAYDDII
jgi:hypothetical protein